MLKDNPAFSSSSVDDLQAAKKFYGETLGLEVKEMPGMGLDITFGNGGQHFIYEKPDHQAATFTILNFPVDDIDKAVDELTAKGITFEQYNNDWIKTDEKGIARSEKPEQGPSVAWFKDPAGNVLSVLKSDK